MNAKVKRSINDISIEAMTNSLIEAVGKDWAHRSIEGSVRPDVAMESWVHSRISSLYRELTRNDVRVKSFCSTTTEVRRYGRPVTTNALFVEMTRGALPLVGILKYDARSWQHFDGRMIFQVAVPTRDFKMDSQNVYACTETGGITNLGYIGARDAALYATFARQRMKVTNRIAVALVHSIGKV